MEKLKPCPFCGGKALFCIKENRTTNCGVGFVFEVECEEGRRQLKRGTEEYRNHSETIKNP